jgi:hypothetical protein
MVALTKTDLEHFSIMAHISLHDRLRDPEVDVVVNKNILLIATI